MKMYLLFAFLLTTLFITTSCETEDITPDENLVSTHIRFDTPEVGQTSYYLGIQRSIRDNEAYTETGDTLKVWIDEAGQNDIYTIKETLTAGSTNYGTTVPDTTSYIISLRAPDSLYLTTVNETNFYEISQLFDRTERTFPFTPNAEEVSIE
ncbi:MAG: hypothetical protein AB8G22_00840, partial [Saprospiraceae bacterium]